MTRRAALVIAIVLALTTSCKDKVGPQPYKNRRYIVYCRFVYDLYVSNLCGWHMNFYREWKDSERVRERDKELIGITMFIDLLSLQAADKGGKDD